MKLLIVDDEALTREGLQMNIDWNSLGIDEVLTADDGINGVFVARQSEPEIILSDVRMPRMTGIEMAIAIRAFLPNTSFIFMSGYSDKEYLKAAIKLQAVSYVEKPIDLAEVTASIVDAVASTKENQMKVKSLSLQKLVTANQLALNLLYPPQEDAFILTQFSTLSIPIKSSTHYSTVIVKLDASIFIDDYEAKLNHMYQHLDVLSNQYHFQTIHGVKHDDHIIFHLIYQDSLSDHAIWQFCHMILDHLTPDYRLFIAVGKTVADAALIHTSYSSAVILLQVAFFREFNSILYDNNVIYTTYQVANTFFTDYSNALHAKDRETVNSLLADIYTAFQQNQYTLVNYVKESYYKLFHTMSNVANELYLNLSEETVDYESILHFISSCPTLSLLHQTLLAKLDKFFECLSMKQSEHSTIHIIKDYISKNYRNETLSVKDISEHVYLSSSYVCTIFKNETGQTLNQFLTEYRVNKAKQILLDPRYRINDISSKVGYADGNYFGKTFKKITGMSPSEFRESYQI